MIQLSHNRLGRIDLRPVVKDDYPATSLRLSAAYIAEAFLGPIRLLEYRSSHGPVFLCSYDLKPAVDLDKTDGFEGLKVILVVEGRLVLQGGLADNCALTAGTLCLFRSARYRISLPENAKVQYLVFAVDPLTSLMKWESFEENRHQLTAGMHVQLAEVLNPPELLGKPEGWLSSQLIYLLSQLRELIALNGHEQQGKPTKTELAFAAEAFMQRHLQRDLTDSDIAKAIGVSEYKMKDAWSSQFDVSPARYQNNLRIAMAKRLLLETDLSIAEISSTCGFNNENCFRNNFKRETTMTPADWRKKYRQ